MALVAWLADWPVSSGLAASTSESLKSLHSLPSPNIFSLPDPDDRSLPDTPSPAVISRLLLPDLRTLPPSDLAIDTLPDGSRELRLSNTIWNSGAGALELEGEFSPETRKTRVVQHVQAQTGTQLDHLVGEFVWHPGHDHWHFAGFSIYELWTLTPAGELDSVASSSGKLSYCVIDTDNIDRQKKGIPSRRRYYGCGQALQGLSAGWGDTYKSFLDGQSIHLAAVEDGFYALKSTVNPDAMLLEANYDNNAALLYLDIRGEHVELITAEEITERRCQENGWC